MSDTEFDLIMKGKPPTGGEAERASKARLLSPLYIVLLAGVLVTIALATA